jgi:hypothetical protein
MPDVQLLIEDEEKAFEPGDALIAQAQWDLSSPPKYLELALVWYTSGKGDRDFKVVERLRLEDLPASGSRRLGIQLPDSPWSFSGKLISLKWALELKVYPGKARARQEFVMAPGRQEIVLGDTTASTT